MSQLVNIESIEILIKELSKCKETSTVTVHRKCNVNNSKWMSKSLLDLYKDRDKALKRFGKGSEIYKIPKNNAINITRYNKSK